ncbi:hypothetical protein PTSG_08701 [Salpingoeca rosetta]|uniref:EF-hand domain-containing protein n=1 Tax=Salpingoeca rosetta (strain ATCC 50818 / BSB-021) TaxID=946362 RepID=F2UKF6_SALR5|nr:uncharacterized protein PTSG_08701 [Salpingoeca rosetta]EGD77605.1 hypothetical protein PTSG_08701 [Salpingoeca rosetta]|eukprot:XP_004990493.1 hypothetical protein PTSG_08701 [Salpingoeca rosetta]
MGSFLGKLFVDPTILPGGDNCGGNHTLYNITQPNDPLNCSESGYGFVQVLFLMFAYAYVLFYASNLISDGSELLLLVPSMRDIVGSVVLPILGAPHGHRGKFQKLTITGRRGLLHTGVSIAGSIRTSAKIMIVTSLSYLIIQGPAFFYERTHHKPTPGETHHQSRHERDWAIAGFAVTMVAFVGYLIYQVKFANIDDAVNNAMRKAIGEKIVSLSGAFALDLQKTAASRRASASEETGLIDRNPARLREFLLSFFHKYDHDKNGSIDQNELALLLRDLNEDTPPSILMKEIDTDNSGAIDFDEFSTAMMHYIMQADDGTLQHTGQIQSVSAFNGGATEVDVDGSDDDEEDYEDEDEDEEEDLVVGAAAHMRAHRLVDALWIFSLYPLSLVIVAVLEGPVGLD